MDDWKFFLFQFIACLATLFIIDGRTAMKLIARACILVGNFLHWLAGVRETVVPGEGVV